MKIPLYRLKTGIMTYLAFLILAAMLLLNSVMMQFTKKELIHDKILMGDIFIHGLSHQLVNNSVFGSNSSSGMKSGNELFYEISRQAQEIGFSKILIVNTEGKKVFSAGFIGDEEETAMSSCRKTLVTKEKSCRFTGRSWAIVWFSHQTLDMCSPLLRYDKFIGAIAISLPLSPLYEKLRQTEKIIISYIVINAVVLVVFGIFLFSRIVVKPVQKLLKATEEFNVGDIFSPSTLTSTNEIGHVFRSLNMMLKRLAENKIQLETHILSLEKANKDLNQAQREIINSEKLASVGRLATGVAHEIGNPIGIVLGYLDLLKRDGLSSYEKQDFLERIESEITRIHVIIRQLLDFSRPSAGEKDIVMVHDLILDTIKMLAPQPMMDDTEIVTVFQASEDSVRADPNQLKQVFLNIFLNAADILSKNRLKDENHPDRITITTENRGAWLVLGFRDTGKGISKDDLGKIFDPFFTTKEPGHGTGLGLSVCYRIIEDFEGIIKAESIPGEGATIIVELPLYRGVSE